MIRLVRSTSRPAFLARSSTAISPWPVRAGRGRSRERPEGHPDRSQLQQKALSHFLGLSMRSCRSSLELSSTAVLGSVEFVVLTPLQDTPPEIPEERYGQCGLRSLEAVTYLHALLGGCHTRLPGIVMSPLRQLCCCCTCGRIPRFRMTITA